MPNVFRPRLQQTLRRSVVVSGRGYWSGRSNRVELHPAAAGTGVVFVRGDLEPSVQVPATLKSRVDASNRTNLEVGSGRLEMVEHLLSALAGLGVDCCLVRVDSEELPGLDGSSQAFVEAIDAAGIVALDEPVDPIVVGQTVRVGDEHSWIEASPPRFAGLSVDYLLDYGPGPIGRQELSISVTPESYRAELAAARTFISLEDAERLRSAGLGLTVAAGDLVLFGPDGPVGNTLRWPDECVRHKVLDVVGDLALAGRPLHAHVRACRSGHRLNAELVGRLVAAEPQGRLLVSA
jgi:UDP-3-O-[3-hydroxymyristoyl] N-acetylglucosamine deacetylase